jgi:hypothetical protein
MPQSGERKATFFLVRKSGKDARRTGVKLKGQIAKLNTDLVVLSDKG